MTEAELLDRAKAWADQQYDPSLLESSKWLVMLFKQMALSPRPVEAEPRVPALVRQYIEACDKALQKQKRGWYEAFLSTKDYCDGCRELFKVENLHFCSGCRKVACPWCDHQSTRECKDALSG